MDLSGTRPSLVTPACLCTFATQAVNLRGNLLKGLRLLEASALARPSGFLCSCPKSYRRHSRIEYDTPLKSSKISSWRAISDPGRVAESFAAGMRTRCKRRLTVITSTTYVNYRASGARIAESIGQACVSQPLPLNSLTAGNTGARFAPFAPTWSACWATTLNVIAFGMCLLRHNPGGQQAQEIRAMSRSRVGHRGAHGLQVPRESFRQSQTATSGQPGLAV